MDQNNKSEPSNNADWGIIHVIIAYKILFQKDHESHWSPSGTSLGDQ